MEDAQPVATVCPHSLGRRGAAQLASARWARPLAVVLALVGVACGGAPPPGASAPPASSPAPETARHRQECDAFADTINRTVEDLQRLANAPAPEDDVGNVKGVVRRYDTFLVDLDRLAPQTPAVRRLLERYTASIVLAKAAMQRIADAGDRSDLVEAQRGQQDLRVATKREDSAIAEINVICADEDDPEPSASH